MLSRPDRPFPSPGKKKRTHRKRISEMRLSSDTTATLPEYNNYASSTRVIPANMTMNMNVVSEDVGLGLDVPLDKPPDYEYEEEDGDGDSGAEEADVDEDTDNGSAFEDRRRLELYGFQQQPQNFTYSTSLGSGSGSSKNMLSQRRKSRFVVPPQKQFGQLQSYQDPNPNYNNRRQQRSFTPLPLNLNSNSNFNHNTNAYTSPPSHSHTHSYPNINTIGIGDTSPSPGGDSVDPYLDALLERSVHALEISNTLLQQSSITTATMTNDTNLNYRESLSPSPSTERSFYSSSPSLFMNDRNRMGYERLRNGGGSIAGGSRSGGGGSKNKSKSGGSGNGRFGRDRYREKEREVWLDDLEEITRKVDRLFGSENGEDDESDVVDERNERIRGKAKGKEEWNRHLHSSFTTDEVNLSCSLPASVSPLHNRSDCYQQQNHPHGTGIERTKRAKRRPSLDSNSTTGTSSRLRLSYRTRDELVAPPPRALTQYIDVESGTRTGKEEVGIGLGDDGNTEFEQFITLPSTLGIRSVISTPILNPTPCSNSGPGSGLKAEWNTSTSTVTSLQHTQESPGPLHSTPALPVIADIGIPPSTSNTPAYNKLAAFVLRRPLPTGSSSTMTTPVKLNERQGGRGWVSVGSTPVSSFIASTGLSSFMVKRRNSITSTGVGGGGGGGEGKSKYSGLGSPSTKKKKTMELFGIGIGIGIGIGSRGGDNQSQNLNSKNSDERPISELGSDSYLSQSQSRSRSHRESGNQNQNQNQSHIQKQKRIMTPPVEGSFPSQSSSLTSPSPSSSSSSSSSSEGGIGGGKCVAKQTVVSLRKILDDHSLSHSTSISTINSSSSTSASNSNSNTGGGGESTMITIIKDQDGNIQVVRIKNREERIRTTPSFMPRTPMPKPVSSTSTATASISRMLTKKVHHSSTRPPNPPRQSALKGSRPVTPTTTSPFSSTGASGGNVGGMGVGVGGGGSANSSGVSTPTKRISFAELPEAHVSSHPEKFKRDRSRNKNGKGKRKEKEKEKEVGSGSRFLVGTLGIDNDDNESGNESAGSSGGGWLSHWFAPAPNTTTNVGVGLGVGGSTLALARHEERLEDRMSRGWGVGRMSMSAGYGYGYLDEWAV